jgi:hypothetical protein
MQFLLGFEIEIAEIRSEYLSIAVPFSVPLSAVYSSLHRPALYLCRTSHLLNIPHMKMDWVSKSTLFNITTCISATMVKGEENKFPTRDLSDRSLWYIIGILHKGRFFNTQRKVTLRTLKLYILCKSSYL